MVAALLPQIDSSTFPISSSTEPSLPLLSYIGEAFLVVSPTNYDQSLDFITSNGTKLKISVDVTSLTSDADIHSLLDAGAIRAFTNLNQLQKLRPAVEDARLVFVLDLAHSKEQIIDAIAETPIAIYAKQVKDLNFVTGFLQEYEASNRPPVYVSFGYNPTVEEVVTITKLQAAPVIPTKLLTLDVKAQPELISVADILNSALTSDRLDGLFTTLVVDERGVGLGLVYSSAESIAESLRTGRGVYQSRKRGLWYKGETSGAVQELVSIDLDCDRDCLRFVVRQKGVGFCHLETATCFGDYGGVAKLQKTLQSRKLNAPAESYTARLFSDEKLLHAKIMEEAEELCNAKTNEEIAFEAADLLYFALTKCIAAGVSLEDIERELDKKSLKVTRRKGDAKGKWAEKEGIKPATDGERKATQPLENLIETNGERIAMQRVDVSKAKDTELQEVLRRPAQKTDDIMGIVTPIIENVRQNGDKALIEYAAKFDKANLSSPVLNAPFPKELMQLSKETIKAIDISFENIRKFHEGQKESETLVVETMPGVRCSRFVRAIERVGLYIPGGTAVLPSTALMLGVPAMVAGCKKIVLASPPRSDGTITPEIVYVAHKVGAEAIVLAGGAQAIAALAYGTKSVPKVDKILGPGNQFVTAGKMFVSNDTRAAVSIDMPAGPSEVLVIADELANPSFVAADLLSQAEHGVDSQVILITVSLSETQLSAIEEALEKQALALPRVDIVRGCIKHSVTLQANDIEEAIKLSNLYAPEHLILQVKDAKKVLKFVEHAGSVFVGPWTPESVGDYSAGVNHSLPTYGYARQYSGVNLGTYVKHITASELTEEGLGNVGGAVMELARVEELEAHRRAVEIRLNWIKSQA